jgi:type 1 glutamine amidotransferase
MKWIAWFLAALPLAAAEPVRLQIVTGGHPHDISFYSVFEGRSDLAITVDGHPSAFRRDLRKFADVVLLYDLADVTEAPRRANLTRFVEGGGGVVVLHHALASNWQWKWWWEEVVGGRFLMGPDAGMERSKAKAGEKLDAKPAARHAILNGVPALSLDDEAYKGMWLSPRSKVLMETTNPNNDRAIVWIGPHPTARVAAIQLGHGAPAHRDPGFRTLVHNAVLWAARRLD